MRRAIAICIVGMTARGPMDWAILRRWRPYWMMGDVRK